MQCRPCWRSSVSRRCSTPASAWACLPPAPRVTWRSGENWSRSESQIVVKHVLLCRQTWVTNCRAHELNTIENYVSCILPPIPHIILALYLTPTTPKRQENLRQDVSIALVGKYTQLNDAYASVIKALEHAALHCNRKLKLLCVEAEDLEEEAKNDRPVKYYEAWQNVCKSKWVAREYWFY